MNQTETKAYTDLINNWPENNSGVSNKEEVAIASAAIAEVIKQVHYGNEAYHVSVVLSLALWARRYTQRGRMRDAQISDLKKQLKHPGARTRIRHLFDHYRDTHRRISYERVLKHIDATRVIMSRLERDPDVPEEYSELLQVALVYLAANQAECFFTSE